MRLNDADNKTLSYCIVPNKDAFKIKTAIEQQEFLDQEISHARKLANIMSEMPSGVLRQLIRFCRIR
jgi:hypothetical protein